MNVFNVLQVFCKSSIISIISHTLYSQCTKTAYIYVQSIGMGELFCFVFDPANIVCDDQANISSTQAILVVLMYDRLRARGRESACVPMHTCMHSCLISNECTFLAKKVHSLLIKHKVDRGLHRFLI